MNELLLAAFPDRQCAQRALAALRRRLAPASLLTARFHQGELDLMLGVDLSGTRAQASRELSVAARFFLPFALLAGIGLVVDLTGAFGGTAMAATMLLGSAGVLAGSLSVLFAALRPFDHALARSAEAVREGQVVLSLPSRSVPAAAVASAVSEPGGRLLFHG